MVVKEILSVDELKNGVKISAIHFYSVGVEQCDHMNVIFDKLSEESKYKNILFFKCNMEQSKFGENYEINQVPTILFFVGNTCFDQLVGADAISLSTKFTELIKLTPDDKGSKLESKLKFLTNYAPVMLFMKGTSEVPQCGFTKKMVSILKELNVDYKSFDILRDEEVRAGLKTFSDWPTYPQLYINGELIGGLDIVNELKSTGDLQEMLSTAKNSSKIGDMLDSLINKADVMMFIKGPEEDPKCKYSKAAVVALRKIGIPFQTYNVLENQEVRQSLKNYSNWPTYPQLYVKGKLIGGWDIMKQLKNEKKLVPTLKGEI